MGTVLYDIRIDVMLETTYAQSLGDYERQVLLHLDTALTLSEAKPLMNGAGALKLIDTIDDCHLHGLTIELCLANIEVLRLELLQRVLPLKVVTVCDCSMLKQQGLT